MIPKDYQQEMAYEESNDHVTDDATWPWKVKRVTRYARSQHLENGWR